MKFPAVLLATVIAWAPTASRAEGPAGAWRVEGKVASFSFTLHCLFETHGGQMTGVCRDGSTSDPTIKSGREHALTRGSVEGKHVAWTYQSSFLFTRFDVAYVGDMDGDHMSGIVRTSGREGVFTAQRE